MRTTTLWYALPEDYRDYYKSNIPRIPLPGGLFLFYMRGEQELVDRLQADPRVQYAIVADSWTELFFSNYRYWEWVFDFEVVETFDGHPVRVRRKLVDVTDQEITGVFVPGVFLGDDVPEFTLPRFIVEKYVRLAHDVRLAQPIITTVSDELVRYIQRNPRALHTLEPRQFEELICNVLTRLGWSVELTPASKDGGYDIVGFSGITGGVKTHWIVECKKYAPERKVGVEIVRALCGVKDQMKAGNAMIVTTSSFTKGALEIAHSRWDLTLKDQRAVLDWVDSAL